MTASSTAAHPRTRAAAFPRATAMVAGLFFVAVGIWAFIAPQSFYESVAVFPPYNQHFLQDVGSFQIGLGAVLLLAVAAPGDGLAIALLGVAVGQAAHTVSHVIGRNLGGNPSTDIPLLAILTVLPAAAGVAQWRVGR